MIIDYLSDHLGCGCHRTLADAIGIGADASGNGLGTIPTDAMLSAATTVAASRPTAMSAPAVPAVREYPYPSAAPPAMDNSRSFAPIYPAKRPCRTCGRGDVNVNVNVATGGSTSTTGGSSAGAGTSATGADDQTVGQPSSAPTRATPSRAEIREEVRKAIEDSRPSFEGSRAPTRVEYRPFAVPVDRVVRTTEYKPFAVVWDRIKRTFVNRDVQHPIDRVRTIPGKVVKGSFEGAPRA
ncbi:MAG: hypothetical protein FGM24_09215 [Candidatus Kapabacteria bacterium]|nr:hypothetical protein [Candidatus Kapabacteria bacterium]